MNIDLDSKPMRVVMAVMVCSSLFIIHKVYTTPRPEKIDEILSIPPIYHNDGSITYSLIDQRVYDYDPEQPDKKAYKEVWKIRIPDFGVCKATGENDVCQEFEFTKREPYYVEPSKKNKGEQHLWFWLSYPDMKPVPPIPVEDRRQRRDDIDPEVVQISFREKRDEGSTRQGKPWMLTDDNGEEYRFPLSLGLAEIAGKSEWRACGLGGEISPGFFQMRELSDAERLEALGGEPAPSEPKVCLNQNEKNTGGTRIVNGAGQTVMQISGAGYPEQKYAYKDDKGRFKAYASCLEGGLARCHFDMTLLPSLERKIDLWVHEEAFPGFREIHDAVTAYVEAVTISVTQVSYNDE